MHMGGSDEGSTFTDFEYQHTSFSIGHFGQPNDANILYSNRVEPLESRGGLESDEVAELVALRGYHQAGLDDIGDPATENSAPGSTETRGVLGVNLAEQETIEDGTNLTESTKYEEVIRGNGTAGGDANGDTFNIDEPGVFWHFDYAFQPAFLDNANGVGGGAASAATFGPETINYRQLFGRGPVVDTTDEIVGLTRMINSRQEYNVEAVGRYTFVWDVSTVEGQRKQFSLPR